ncbi:MAG: hypothetical protein EOO91_10470 [Pedobacter sp.]|nr:MAG: hypothetical protein EOO91_10470 [Pedobacter sp.]
MKEKSKVILTIVAFLSLISAVIYLMMRDGDSERDYNIQKVQKAYDKTKGVVTKISSYKGHSVHIRYIVEGKTYNYEGGFDSNPNGLGEGDSLKIKYAIDSPQYVISELDENYNRF